MTFAYDEKHIWLDDLTGTDQEDGVDLCSRHADNRTGPLGWTLTDRRRSGDRQLFIPVDSDDRVVA